MDQIKLTTNKGRVFGPFGGEFSFRPAAGAELWSRSFLTAASVPANQDAGYGSNSVSCHKFRGENMEKFEKMGKIRKNRKKYFPIFPLVHFQKESRTPRQEEMMVGYCCEPHRAMAAANVMCVLCVCVFIE